MANYTENYGFALPTDDDRYDISVYNSNFESLDVVLKDTELGIDEVSEKIGTDEDTDTTSVFGKLNVLQNAVGNGISIIKSIQHVTFTAYSDTTGGTISINEVDTAKTLVLFERLGDSTSSGCSKLTYTLNSTSLVIVGSGLPSGSCFWGFWIIEFC